MDKQVLNSKIGRTAEELIRLQNDLYALERTDVTLYPGNFAELAGAAALRSERITGALRQLACFPPPHRTIYLPAAADIHGITVSEAGGVLTITLPCLIPKRGGKSSGFLIEPLLYCFQEYAMSHHPVLHPRSSVCFFHIYDERLHPKFRDYDNMECKQVLDAVALFFLPDDSGSCCDIYHTTRCGETDKTQIFILDTVQFPTWLEQQNTPG